IGLRAGQHHLGSGLESRSALHQERCDRGIMLGLGRALGETMAVTFVIGNSFNLPDSIFAPSNSIASALANEFNEAGGMQKAALLELGLILFLITTIVLAFSKVLLLRLSKSEG